MRIIILVLFLLCGVSSFSQQLELRELLEEAKMMYWDFPEHSIQIAEYVLNQQEKAATSAKANLVLSKSYLTQDRIFESIKAIFKAQDLAQKSEDISLRIEIKLFGIQLLQQLELTTISDELKSEINLLKDRLTSSTAIKEIENKLLLLNAELALHQEDLSNSQRFFSALNSEAFPSSSNYNIQVELGKAQLKFKQSKPDEAREILQQLPPEIPKYFQILKLNLLGSIELNNKQFEHAILHWNQAKEMAIQIPNNKLAKQSLEGLIQVYLILEDSKKYLAYKQESNKLSSELITDRVRAVNLAYNHYENSNLELAQNSFTSAQRRLYLGSAGFILMILVTISLNYYYRLRTKEYQAFKKLVLPSPATSNKKVVTKSLVSEETEKHILQELKIFESSNDFTRQDMSIAFLAARLNTNTKYLSDVIKRHKEKNFNGYINELRIEYIIDKLKTDATYLNYKISYLAEESGFSSHSSFTTVFKSVTGISPTKLIALLQKEGSHDY